MLVKIDNCLTFHKEDRYEMYIGKVKKRLGFHNTKEDEFPHALCQHTLQSLAAASSRPPSNLLLDNICEQSFIALINNRTVATPLSI